jgi:thiosulfate reductase cytochrome b subunit
MTKQRLLLIGVVLLLAGAVTGIAAGQEPPPTLADDTLHPTFPLLDAEGGNVLDSGEPVSTMATCGTCHDTAFIANHTDHSDAALTALTREVGFTQEGPQQTVEMNCFLCHMEGPDSTSYAALLERGDYAAANTATLITTGAVGDDLSYNTEAFTEEGMLQAGVLTVGDPANENCAMCHGTIHTDLQTPFTLDDIGWMTATSGQVFSPQRLANSGLNLSGKNDLSRSFDIHTERVVECVDCHHAANNPIFTSQSGAARPDHLTFDPRRMDFGDYLEQPVHQLNGTENSPLTCAGCHDAAATHDWLPYAERHTQVLACESCHVPQLFAPAVQSTDWTVLTEDDQAVMEWRGLEGSPDDLTTSLVTGFQPVLLPTTFDETAVLAPHNVITTWYWVDGDTPVSRADLRTVYLDEKGRHLPDVVALFDANGDGTLSDAELMIDTEEKQAVIAEKLTDLGYVDPQIVSEVQPYAIHHNVTHGEWATASCESCHTADSRLVAPVVLAGRTPGGVLPTFEGSGGEMMQNADGSLQYQPQTQPTNEAISLYVLGHDAVRWIDFAGVAMLLGTLGGVTVHGGLRVMAAKRYAKQQAAPVEEIYMYTVYERLWHWLQSGVIFILLFTGLVIHKPDLFGAFGFRGMVLVHNVMAAVLLINATLAAFYHVASGEIKQFLPQPRGFFSNAIQQSLYYLRGIFKDEPHPFEKTPARKLNPLQQIVYFGLLNVLLPLQVITGVLMWGLQHWPQLAGRLGGLPLLGPLHTLVAWMFATFIVAHIYLTTTGHTPLASIRGMIMGWDEVEVHEGAHT